MKTIYPVRMPIPQPASPQLLTSPSVALIVRQPSVAGRFSCGTMELEDNRCGEPQDLGFAFPSWGRPHFARCYTPRRHCPLTDGGCKLNIYSPSVKRDHHVNRNRYRTSRRRARKRVSQFDGCHSPSVKSPSSPLPTPPAATRSRRSSAADPPLPPRWLNRPAPPCLPPRAASLGKLNPTARSKARPLTRLSRLRGTRPPEDAPCRDQLDQPARREEIGRHGPGQLPRFLRRCPGRARR